MRRDAIGGQVDPETGVGKNGVAEKRIACPGSRLHHDADESSSESNDISRPGHGSANEVVVGPAHADERDAVVVSQRADAILLRADQVSLDDVAAGENEESKGYFRR